MGTTSTRRALTVQAPLVAVAAIVAGCSASVQSFEAQRYYHSRYDYLVRYEAGDDEAPQLLSEEWFLDNFYRDRHGRLVLRVGPDYEEDITYDGDGDGLAERTQARAPIYDLRLVHEAHDSAIWLSSFPISQRLSRTDLRVLADRYVESVAGAGYAHVQLGEHAAAGIERRFATRIVDAGETVVDGEPGYAVTFEVANVDQLELDSASRRSRIRIVFLRPGFAWVPEEPGVTSHWPVLVAIGYRAMPEYFDAGLSDFERFLAQVDVSPTRDAMAERQDAFFRCWDSEMATPREAAAVEIAADDEGRVSSVRVRVANRSGRPGVGPRVDRVARCFEEELDGVTLPRAGRTTVLAFDPRPRPAARADVAAAPSPAVSDAAAPSGAVPAESGEVDAPAADPTSVPAGPGAPAASPDA